MRMDILEKVRKTPYEPKKEGDDYFEWAKKYLNPLKSLLKETEKRFAQHIPEHTAFFDHEIGETMGIEAVRLSRWKQLRKKVPDRQLFDFVLFEAVAAHLIFYMRYAGDTTTDIDSFVEAFISSKVTHHRELAKTYRWLKERNIPEEYRYKQKRLVKG